MGGPFYRLHAPPLRWRCWDDDHLVYHDASGSTHLLDRLGAALLRSLEARPRSRGDLHRDHGDTPEARERIGLLLQRFESLGVVKCTP